MKKQIIVPALILLFLIIATTLVILYGKGYRIAFKKDLPQISKTGLLVTNSIPNGAQVFIDNHLTTATDNTITLPPGTYNIKIQKEGYFPWEKKLIIKEEIVTKAEARLFPVAPRLESIATTSVQNPMIDPSGTKIAFQIASESAIRKNGIYILNMTSNIPVPILTLQSSSTQIADNTIDLFSEAKLKWSPDGTQILAQIDKIPGSPTTYLLLTNRFNETPQDVTAILQSVKDEWNQQKQETDNNLISGLKKNMRQMISDNFSVIAWSPDKSKILYAASTSAQLPLILKPRRLGINTLVEKRQLTKGDIYAYDTKEDTNMHIPVKLPASCLPVVTIAKEGVSPTEASANDEPLALEDLPLPNRDQEAFVDCALPISWLPNSKHLLYINDKKLIIMDEDGSNDITVYAGPFVDTFAVTWPDTSKLVILTNLSNPNVSPTLYTIGLK